MKMKGYEKSVQIVKDGIESLKNCKEEKQKYRDFLKRIEELPDDYRFAYKKMTEYMWSYYGGKDGYDMIAIQTDLLELLEEKAAEGIEVLEVTGPDVASFCDELLKNVTTYPENQRQRFNGEFQRKLKNTPKGMIKRRKRENDKKDLKRAFEKIYVC